MKQDDLIKSDMSFAELERLRVAFNVPQGALCLRMGINTTTYSRWKSNAARGVCRMRQSSLNVLRRNLRGMIEEKIRQVEAALAPAE